MKYVVRPMHPTSDRASVRQVFEDAADYVALERGALPGRQLVDEFFDDAPPGSNPAQSLRLGLADATGRIAGVAEVSFGYPSRGDAYLGLLILTPDARGGGQGHAFLREIERLARAQGATRLYLAVLDANPRGAAFWRREGFATVWPLRRVALGARSQFASRMLKPL